MTFLYTLFATPFGWMGVLGSEAGLRRIALPHTDADAARVALLQGIHNAEEDAAAFAGLLDRFRRYFAGEQVDFPDRLDLTGITPFQRAVYAAVRAVPYGATASYAEIARRIGQPLAWRAVGRVNATTPWPIVVPCHRLIGSDGSLCGYGGGLAMKQALLELERAGRRNRSS